MFGDSFFTANYLHISVKALQAVFVPMFGDPFFTMDGIAPFIYQGRGFSSPCLGILFSQEKAKIKTLKEKHFYTHQERETYYKMDRNEKRREKKR